VTCLSCNKSDRIVLIVAIRLADAKSIYTQKLVNENTHLSVVLSHQ
jgi:hypothetical protein